MQVQLKSSKVNFIGDPHFGKKFPDVPLHRRGEREAAQSKEFLKQLTTDADICIMVGDLFDTFLVSNEVLFEVYSILKLAAEQNPKREFLMMEGNHDIARNDDTITSFDILVKMLTRYENIHFFQKTDVFNTTRGERILLCPYAEFSTAEAEVEPYANETFDLAVGHWDTDEVAGPHNLVPLGLLAKMTPLIVTGHVHTQETRTIKWVHPENGLQTSEFYRTGSMLPYSHGEDPEGVLYITRTLEQIAIETSENPDVYKDKCLRVLLIGDEQPPVDLNTLQFSVKRIDSLPKEKMEVNMETFSFEALWRESFAENNVTPELTEHYWEQYKQKATHDSES